MSNISDIYRYRRTDFNPPAYRLHAYGRRVKTRPTLTADEEHAIVAALTAFADTAGALPAHMRDAGVDVPVIEACRASIDTQAEQLARLRTHA